jgi:hypothetical protein
VNSLYAVFEKAEPGFQEKYFALLEAGGTRHHKELLAPFGLDATDPGFWQMGLSVIARMIDELEAMEAPPRMWGRGQGEGVPPHVLAFNTGHAERPLTLPSPPAGERKATLPP